MERRINKKFDSYVTTFKDDIRDKISELGIQTDEIDKLLQFIYDYERMSLVKEDFMKRKRVKNSVPYCDRCFAKRASGEQCTRRKKDGFEYCGTHMKGTPHGTIEVDENAIISNRNQSY